MGKVFRYGIGMGDIYVDIVKSIRATLVLEKLMLLGFGGDDA